MRSRRSLARRLSDDRSDDSVSSRASTQRRDSTFTSEVRDGDRARSEERRDHRTRKRAVVRSKQRRRRTKAETRSNWALQNIYEPGSTFKVVAFSAALEKNLVKPEDRIDCQMGAITVAGRVIRDHTAFGTLTISEALEKSSNVAAIKLGLRVAT